MIDADTTPVNIKEKAIEILPLLNGMSIWDINILLGEVKHLVFLTMYEKPL